MIKITNPEKIIEKNIEKIDLICFYEKVSNLILPYLKQRPVSEIRCHNGFSDCFFRKHPQNDSSTKIYINSKTDLIKECQMGSIEFHPESFAEKGGVFMMVFDLDPDEKISLAKLRAGTLMLKKVLDDLSLKSFLKTSGGKGYHVVVPFKSVKNENSFSDFSQKVALLLESAYPQKFTTNMRKSERKGKIFIDYLRNKNKATCVAPYSLRARTGLPVSLPIAWDDLNKITPYEISIKNIDRYLQTNPWQNFFKIKQEIK